MLIVPFNRQPACLVDDFHANGIKQECQDLLSAGSVARDVARRILADIENGVFHNTFVKYRWELEDAYSHETSRLFALLEDYETDVYELYGRAIFGDDYYCGAEGNPDFIADHWNEYEKAIENEKTILRQAFLYIVENQR